MKNAARVALALAVLSAPAFADDTQTTSANTLVVVTPNAPVIIQQGQAQVQGPGGQSRDVEAAPAATAVPQNEDWNNVSHINGSIVQVGERGAYLKAFKKTNISSDPLAWMFGSFSVSASYAVSNNIVIRGDVSFGKQLESSDGVEVGISAPIYLKRAYSGPFIEPGLLLRSFSQDNYSYDGSTGASSDTMTTNSAMLAEVMIGWHWSFDSGLNFAMAFGAAREISNGSSSPTPVANSADSYSSSSSSSSSEPHPVGYFRVGYSF